MRAETHPGNILNLQGETMARMQLNSGGSWMPLISWRYTRGSVRQFFQSHLLNI